MGIKKIKVVQEVFSDISKGLPYMWKFIEKNLEEICSRERISVKEGFFFLFLCSWLPTIFAYMIIDSLQYQK